MCFLNSSCDQSRPSNRWHGCDSGGWCPLSCGIWPEPRQSKMGRVCGILRRAKPPKDNLKKEQRKALKEMKYLEDEVILPADKGNATVVMRREDYSTKLKGMLETSTYRRLWKDPTATQESRLSRKLKELKKSGEIIGNLYHQLRPTGSQPTRIYGLPKIYKPEVSLRPVLSCIGSPSYQLSRHIASLISPLAGKTDSYVRNSRHFVEVMRNLRVEEDEVLVSFDVSSLFWSMRQCRSSVTGCRMTGPWVTGPPFHLTESQNCWKCAWSPPNSAMKGPSMSNANVRRWVNLSSLWWPTFTWHSSRSLPWRSPSEAPPLEEVCWWHLLHCEEGHNRMSPGLPQQCATLHWTHCQVREGWNAPVPRHPSPEERGW